ncbi:hydroxyacid dehydrogenase [Nocardiopsis sp. NPDC101807]|uniref:hydroxyacid dehydrogenase n=1 Tax=Nocardiopsis sp. NPDC101807 TaxID=3364339 RepID=UPI00381F59D5
MDRSVVVVADPLPETVLGPLRGHDVRFCDGSDPSALKEALGDARALLVRSSTQVDRSALTAAPNLRIIARAGVGLDNIDVEAATRAGVLVANAPRSNVLSVAEMTVGSMITGLRNLLPANAALRSGRWDRGRYQGRELSGSTVGLVGLGHVGTLVAQLLRPFAVRLLVHDPFVSVHHAVGMEAHLVDLDELMAQSDVVSVHVPRTPQTKGLIGERELRLAKPSLLLVNTARGGIVDEGALNAALKEKSIRGAVIDVFEIEPAIGNPLIDHESVLATPHLGAGTHEAQERAGREAVTAVLQALAGHPVPTAVNPSASHP